MKPGGQDTGGQRGSGSLNPPFDRRMRSIGGPDSGSVNLTRGWIVTDDSPRQRVNFLFNPQSVLANHPTNWMFVGSGAQSHVDKSDTFGAQVGTVQFSLLFDRTYEVWDRTNKSKANTWGVYADVLAFYTIMGMQPVPSGAGMPYPNSTPVPINVWVYFGALMKYYGIITELDVTYTHWSGDMVPMRCGVDVQFLMLPQQTSSVPPPSTSTDGNHKQHKSKPKPKHPKPHPGGVHGGAQDSKT